MRTQTLGIIFSITLTAGCFPGEEEEARGDIGVGEPCSETQECIPGTICFERFCVGDGELRVSLSFPADSDFDLHLQTPSGSEIYFANPLADGGELDVDQCISPCGAGPHVENIVFVAAQSGTYSAWVENFDGRAGGVFSIEISGSVSMVIDGELPPVSGAASEPVQFSM